MKASSVAIVGSGATGVAVLNELSRLDIFDRYELFDKNEPGRGFAFNHEDDCMICNTSPDMMSISSWVPGEFVEYLVSRGVEVGSGYFSPRSFYRDYVIESYKKISSHLRSVNRDVVHHSVLVDRISIVDGGGYELRASDGRVFRSDVVVIATGLEDCIVPDVLMIL